MNLTFHLGINKKIRYLFGLNYAMYNYVELEFAHNMRR